MRCDDIARHASATEQRFSVGIERVLRQPEHEIRRPEGFEIGVAGRAVHGKRHEVAEHGQKVELRRRIRRVVRARVAHLELAVVRAAVAVFRVAVVACLGHELQSIAAFRGAAADRAVGLELAGGRTSVAVDDVRIVARFRAFLLPVAAHRHVALRRHGGIGNGGRRGADVARFELARRRASLSRVGRVALLRSRQHGVAAMRDAELPGLRAVPAAFDHASRRASVARLRVAVVARLLAADATVSALHEVEARHPRLWASPILFDGLAIGRASVGRFRVAVVASFSEPRIDLAVAASDGARGGIGADWTRVLFRTSAAVAIGDDDARTAAAARRIAAGSASSACARRCTAASRGLRRAACLRFAAIRAAIGLRKHHERRSQRRQDKASMHGPLPSARSAGHGPRSGIVAQTRSERKTIHDRGSRASVAVHVENLWFEHMRAGACMCVSAGANDDFAASN